MPELDGLRAVAVLSVLFFHAMPNGPASGGFVGVDVFFVLSGFLITSILEVSGKQDRLRLRRFYWHRVLRLMPPLLLFLASYLLVAPFVWPDHNHLRDTALSAGYISNYTYAFWRLPLYLQHTWSLSVEEQFYLIWPLVLSLLIRSRSPLVWLLSAYVASTFWRFSFGEDWLIYYYRSDARVSGLILGAVIYFSLSYVRASAAAAWGGALILTMIVLLGRISDAAWYIPFAEGASAVIICAIWSGKAGAIGSALRWRPVVMLGKLSYGIYLWHYPIAYALRDDLPFVTTTIIVLGSSVALAALSYVTVEAWARRIKSSIVAPNPPAPSAVPLRKITN